MGTSIAEEKKAVEAGYWHLYRFNPDLRSQGKNPFILDSKAPSADYKGFIKGEVRYSQLANIFPDIAGDLFEASAKDAAERYGKYKSLAEHQMF